MRWFPKRKLKNLRKKAILATSEIAVSENSWGARNIQKQFDAISALRDAIKSSENSIGSDRVVIILNHGVPQIRSLLDLTSPKPGERGDLLAKQCTEAILANIDLEIDKIEARLWRRMGLPGIFVAVSTVAALLIRFWPQIKAFIWAESR